MNQSYPVPPPELLEQWSTEANRQDCVSYTKSIAIDAAQWGADQELEACCEWVKERRFGGDGQGWSWATSLRAFRRPKPPSLKEQALEQCNDYIDPDGIIRRALEQLND